MRYVLLFVLLSSCWQADNETRVLDTSVYDAWLTISHDLKTAKLHSRIDDTPKIYPLHLHAFINRERPLAKDNEGNYLPFAIQYVVFSYWRDQPSAEVLTCVEKDVAISTNHKLNTENCQTGEDFFQEMRACANDEDRHFEIDEHNDLSCVARET